jgi:hypothetical protein
MLLGASEAIMLNDTVSFLVAIAFAGITLGPLVGLAIALVGRLSRGSIAPQRRLIEHMP